MSLTNNAFLHWFDTRNKKAVFENDQTDVFDTNGKIIYTISGDEWGTLITDYLTKTTVQITGRQWNDGELSVYNLNVFLLTF